MLLVSCTPFLLDKKEKQKITNVTYCIGRFPLGSAWQTWDSRLITKSKNLILWCFVLLNDWFLRLGEWGFISYKSEIEILLTVSKMIYYEKKRGGFCPIRAPPVLWGSSWGSGPPRVTCIASIAHIWPRYSHGKFWNDLFDTK